jgi:hypothetical protein
MPVWLPPELALGVTISYISASQGTHAEAQPGYGILSDEARSYPKRGASSAAPAGVNWGDLSSQLLPRGQLSSSPISKAPRMPAVGVLPSSVCVHVLKAGVASPSIALVARKPSFAGRARLAMCESCCCTVASSSGDVKPARTRRRPHGNHPAMAMLKAVTRVVTETRAATNAGPRPLPKSSRVACTPATTARPEHHSRVPLLCFGGWNKKS